MRFVSFPGTLAYDDASELQLEAVEQRARDEIPDTVFFLEHDPVVTRGRGLQWTGMPRARHAPILEPLPEGVAYFETERGGDLTYHGPGQLVIYPIVKLDGLGWGPRRDVAAYLRKLEGVLIGALGEAGIAAEARQGATGVWVGARKVVSIGVAVRRWVTYHGAALNVVNDLGPFSAISPCGFAPEVMDRVGPEAAPGRSWREAWEGRLERAFSGVQLTPSRAGAAQPVRIEPCEKLLEPDVTGACRGHRAGTAAPAGWSGRSGTPRASSW